MILFSQPERNRNEVDSYLPMRKKKPDYFDELRQLAKTSLIFIAVDKASLMMIRRFNQPCLFCKEDASVYDLDFCYQREIWVLYADTIRFIPAMQLAYTAQRSGASKVCAILVDSSWVKESMNV